MKMMQNKLSAIVGVAFLMSSFGVVHAGHLVLSSGKRIEGSGVRVNASGAYVIKTRAGDRAYPAHQVKEAVADKPGDYEKVMRLVNAKKYRQAIPMLEAIARQYRKVGWDDQANKVLGQIYLEQNNGAKAYDAFQKISTRFLARPDVKLLYWKVLSASENISILEKELDIAIRDSRDRSLAARAQIMRGDLKMKRSQIEEAVLDYLRTVILFESEKKLQPEALFKAASALAKLRDCKAVILFDTLKKKYPNSPYALQAP